MDQNGREESGRDRLQRRLRRVKKRKKAQGGLRFESESVASKMRLVKRVNHINHKEKCEH